MGSACMGRMKEQSPAAVSPLDPSKTVDDYDNVLDSTVVERFLTKALCSGDIKTSLLCIMMSAGCKDAFYEFLAKSLEPMAYHQYIQNLNFFMDNYRRTNGNCRLATGCEWTHQHAEMVTKFISDSSFKTWRAVESANVLSAMAECSIEDETSYTQCIDLKRTCSISGSGDDEITMPSCTASSSSASLHSSRSATSCGTASPDIINVNSVSLDVLHSMKTGCTEAMATGSVWMVQYLSMMEDFPIPFTLAKVSSASASTSGSSPSIVYANKSFEKFSGCSRFDIVNNQSTNCGMDDVFSCPRPQEMADTELCGSFTPFWTSGFNGAYAPVSIQTSYSFKGLSKLSSPLSYQGQCVLALKPIYNSFGELCYIAKFYEPILSRSALSLAIVANARKRNMKFLNSLPSIVCTGACEK